MTRQESQHLAWLTGGIGLIGTALGWSIKPAAFPHAWLAAFTTWLQWPLGCLGLLLIHALTGGSWGYALRPQFVAGIRTFWLLVPAAIPWLLTLPELYPWARPGAAAHLANGFYLNRPFFFGRVLLYLVAWLGLRALTSRALRAEQPDRVLARIAPGGLIVLALTLTFSSIDFTLSLDPHFNSSVYGLIRMSEMGLFALSSAVLAASLAGRSRTSPELLPVLGKLLLGILLLRAYLDFMQLLIVWESDLPAEASWYLVRRSGGWGMTAVSITVGYFVLPWCALIWPQVRRSWRGIRVVSGLLTLTAIVHQWWLVVPASGLPFGPVDVAAMLCVLGFGVALSLREPRNGPSLPAGALAAGDPRGG